MRTDEHIAVQVIGKVARPVISAIAGTGANLTWYVRPSGGSYGAEDGTSYDQAWDGFSNIDWTASGVQAGDTLIIAGTHTELFTVGASGTSDTPILIRGNYAGDAGVIDSEDTRDIGVNVSSKNYVTITSLSSIDAVISCFNFEGTSSNFITNSITATGSGNQGIQHLNTASGTHNNPTCDDNVDDGMSGHDSVTIAVDDGIFSNNAEGINAIDDATFIVTGAPTFTNNSAYDIYAVSATTDESCWIDITGATFPSAIRANNGGKLILRSCTANGDVDVAVSALQKGYLEAYDSTIAGDLDCNDLAEVVADNCTLGGTTDIAGDVTNITLTDCTVTQALIINFPLTATGTIFNGQVRFSTGGVSTLNNCLISTLYGAQAVGTCTMNECYIEDDTAWSGTLVANYCLFNGTASDEHLIDIISGGDLTIKYSIFKGMAASKFGIALRTGATAVIDGCTFFGATNVGSGIFTQIDQIVDNCIFTELDNGILLSGTPSVTLNNNCFYDNNTDITGAPTNNNPQTTDPVLTDPGNNDFSLDTGSSCIGNGLDLGGVLDDGIDTANWGNGSTTVPVVTTKEQEVNWNIGAHV